MNEERSKPMSRLEYAWQMKKLVREEEPDLQESWDMYEKGNALAEEGESCISQSKQLLSAVQSMEREIEDLQQKHCKTVKRANSLSMEGRELLEQAEAHWEESERRRNE